MYIVEKFLEQEKSSFKTFTEFMAIRVLEATFKAIPKTLKDRLKENDNAKVVVPWGTFTATRRVSNSGDSANTNVSYEPSDAFLETLNGDNKNQDSYYQVDFDEELMKAFDDYVLYGMFDKDAPENKEKIALANKGIKLTQDQSEYFMNRIATLLIAIGKEKQRDGKEYPLKVDGQFGHGVYNFEYDDDKIMVRFTADKEFKQSVKNDEATGN